MNSGCGIESDSIAWLPLTGNGGSGCFTTQRSNGRAYRACTGSSGGGMKLRGVGMTQQLFKVLFMFFTPNVYS